MTFAMFNYKANNCCKQIKEDEEELDEKKHIYILYDKGKSVQIDLKQQLNEEEEQRHVKTLDNNENKIIAFDKKSTNQNNREKEFNSSNKKRRSRNECSIVSSRSRGERSITEDDVQQQEIVIGCRGRNASSTNCNHNYYNNYYFNKINQAYNAMKTATTRVLSKATTWDTSLSLLSRVFLFLLLTTTTTTTTTAAAATNAQILTGRTSGGLAAKTTIAVTLMALQILPIATTTTTITSSTISNIHHDDLSTGVLQQQKQHLFELLTKRQRLRQQQQQPDIMKEQSDEAIILGRELLRRGRGGGGFVGLPLNIENDNDDIIRIGMNDGNSGSSNSNTDDDDDDDDSDVDALSLKLIEDYVAEKGNIALVGKSINNRFLETSGFVADDGDQYEKIFTNNIKNQQHQLATANSKNCPKSCKCLNDFFDCGKLQLEQVPDLPDYVKHL